MEGQDVKITKNERKRRKGLKGKTIMGGRGRGKWKKEKDRVKRRKNRKWKKRRL